MKNKPVVTLAAFTLAPLLTAVASIISVPVLIQFVGVSIWISIAVGQALAEIFRAFTVWGWNSLGLVTIANLSESNQIKYYFKSLRPRLYIFCAGIPIILYVCYSLPQDHKIEIVTLALAGGISGISATWMYIGTRDTLPLLLLDALPKFLGIVVGTLLSALTTVGLYFCYSLLITNIFICFSALLYYINSAKKKNINIEYGTNKESLKTIRSGFKPFVVGFLTALRMSLPVFISPWINQNATSTIALADKFTRWANTGITPLMQFVQTSIRSGLDSTDVMIKKKLKLTFTSGFFVFVGSFILIQQIWPVISGGGIPSNTITILLIATIITSVYITGIVGNSILVYLNKINIVFIVSSFSLIVFAMVVFIYDNSGFNNLLLAYTCSELFISITVVIYTYRKLRHEISD